MVLCVAIALKVLVCGAASSSQVSTNGCRRTLTWMGQERSTNNFHSLVRTLVEVESGTALPRLTHFVSLQVHVRDYINNLGLRTGREDMYQAIEVRTYRIFSLALAVVVRVVFCCCWRLSFFSVARLPPSSSSILSVSEIVRAVSPALRDGVFIWQTGPACNKASFALSEFCLETRVSEELHTSFHVPSAPLSRHAARRQVYDRRPRRRRAP